MLDVLTPPGPRPTREDYIRALERIRDLEDLKRRTAEHFQRELIVANAEADRIQREIMS